MDCYGLHHHNHLSSQPSLITNQPVSLSASLSHATSKRNPSTEVSISVLSHPVFVFEKAQPSLSQQKEPSEFLQLCLVCFFNFKSLASLDFVSDFQREKIDRVRQSRRFNLGFSEGWVDLRLCLDCEGFGCAFVGKGISCGGWG